MAAVGAVVACGDEGADTASGPVPFSDFAAAYSQAFCDEVGPCCHEWIGAYDAAECRTMLAGLTQFILNDLRARPGYVYDADDARACADAVGVIAQSCAPTPEQMKTWLSACTRFGLPGVSGVSAISGLADASACGSPSPVPSPCGRGDGSGTTAPGEPCESADECRKPDDGEVTCSKWTVADASGQQTVESVCQELLPGQPGDPCDWLAVQLGAGKAATRRDCDHLNGPTFCNTTEGRCEEKPDVGMPCARERLCAEGAYCLDGTCTATIALGGSCKGRAGECGPEGRCDSGTCVPRFVAVDFGVCGGVPSAPPNKCEPGATAPCSCGMTAGTDTCKGDGSGWSGCVCRSVGSCGPEGCPDAGSPSCGPSGCGAAPSCGPSGCAAGTNSGCGFDGGPGCGAGAGGGGGL